MGLSENLKLFFGDREKPYHQTGEVPKDRYLQRLTPCELLCLNTILSHMQSVASSIGTPIHVLAVGSSADMSSTYGDIDLLVVAEDGETRFKFAQQVYDLLNTDSALIILRETSRGSAVAINTPHVQFKLFAFSRNILELNETNPKIIDITFLGERGGSYDEVLSFHQQNYLAFSRL